MTKYGQFLFNRMLTFGRALGLVLRDLSWESVVPFLDDIVIFWDEF